jgi:hypothetical protein
MAQQLKVISELNRIQTELTKEFERRGKKNSERLREKKRAGCADELESKVVSTKCCSSGSCGLSELFNDSEESILRLSDVAKSAMRWRLEFGKLDSPSQRCLVFDMMLANYIGGDRPMPCPTPMAGWQGLTTRVQTDLNHYSTIIGQDSILRIAPSCHMPLPSTRRGCSFLYYLEFVGFVCS